MNTSLQPVISSTVDTPDKLKSPSFSITEEGDDLVILGTAPGFQEASITVKCLDSQNIMISGNKVTQYEEHNESPPCIRKGSSCQQFSECFKLPHSIEPSSLETCFELSEDGQFKIKAHKTDR